MHGTAVLHVPSAAGVDHVADGAGHAVHGGGTNLVVCSVESSDQGGVNLDYVALA